MSALLPWTWVLTLPGLVLTAAGVGRRPGIASIWGPLVMLLAALAWFATGAVPGDVVIPNWAPFLPDGSLHLRADALAALMLAILGFVSFFVYVYSLSYMEGDPGQRRFFCYLDFFVAAMALLVLGGTLGVLLVGWAGVGLASFLLISFWRDRPGTLRAGLDALAANMLGDAALLLAAVIVPSGCGDLTTLGTPRCTAGLGGAALLAWLLLIAAAAKSAQGPLYFWIPTAMAGPTPVSALIHAATMVAAGVYLLVRTHAVLELAPGVMLVTAWLGTLTMLGGGIVSLFQRNFKRGLAYSTISQLGYMFAAAGLAAPFASIFHLFTHAFFKALLFLAAGVAIHATGGEEDLARLGGLRRRLPVSFGTFLVGALALIGFPATSGGFSKDAIIDAGLRENPLIGYLLLAGALVTGLYIGRLLFGVYFGPERTHPHHEPALQVWPLVPLAIMAVVAGYFEWPGGGLSRALTPVLGAIEPLRAFSATGLAAAVLGLAGIGLSWPIVQSAPGATPAEVGTGWADALGQAGYSLSRGLAGLQTGLLTRYALASLLGVAVILLLAARL